MHFTVTPADGYVMAQYQHLGVSHPNNQPVLHHADAFGQIFGTVVGIVDGVLFFVGKLAFNGVGFEVLLIHGADEHGSYTMPNHFTRISHRVDGIIDRIIRHRLVITALGWERITGIAG